jgi:hypothetical protein
MEPADEQLRFADVPLADGTGVATALKVTEEGLKQVGMRTSSKSGSNARAEVHIEHDRLSERG